MRVERLSRASRTVLDLELPGRDKGGNVRIFDMDDVVALLRRQVDTAGGQVAWSKMTGNNRAVLNGVLKGHRQPTPRMIAALNLRMVFVRGNGSWPKRLSRQKPAAGGDGVTLNLYRAGSVQPRQAR